MRKRLFFVVLTFVAMSHNAGAQQIAIGVRGGLSIPNLTSGGSSTPLSEGYSSRLAVGGGIFTDILFTNTFALQVGLDYSGQGGKKTGLQALPGSNIFGAMSQPGMEQLIATAQSVSPEYLYANFKSEAKLHYLMLPVQAKFGWDLGSASPFRVYVTGGIFGSYLLSAKRVSTGTSALFADPSGTTMSNFWANNPAQPGLPPQVAGALTQIFAGMDVPNSLDNTQNITPDLYRFNFGFIASVGIAYNFARNSLFAEVGGNYGLVQIQKSDSNGQNRIGAAVVMIGYSYKL